MMKDKKVAIVSCYFQHNYGSQLQAFATQQILDDLGINNYTIDNSGLDASVKGAKVKYYLSHITDYRIFANKMLAEKTGCIIVSLPHMGKYKKVDKNYSDIEVFDAGPEEFVNLIIFLVFLSRITLQRVFQNLPIIGFERDKDRNLL